MVKKPSSTALTAKLIFFILMASTMGMSVSATNHTVGGATGWDLNSNMATWVKTTIFYTGDNLVFIYSSTAHNVLEVDQNGFQGCQANKPISTHTDGNTIIPLTRSGTRYFICGIHCQQGLKVQVNVLRNSTGSSPNRNHNKPPAPKPPKRSPPSASTHKFPPPPPKKFNNQPPPTSTPMAPPPESSDDVGSSLQSQFSTLLSILFLVIVFVVLSA
ncbi:hypothetical protein ACHQM5_019129 [Ranunculus cassubicifolius]